MQTPDIIYGELFEAVQLGKIFEDNKTFVDLIPKFSPEKILADFDDAKAQADFDLKQFVEENFSPQASAATEFKSDATQKVSTHVSNLWELLTRKKDEDIEGSSLLALPHPYIVPGGRFKEIYYWDSYFTMLGLAEDGKLDMVESMIKNFAYLIEQLGHIPNGNRTYFVSRSQPPFFALMVDLLSKHRGEEVLLEYLPYLEKEYQFWMAPESNRTIYVDGYRLNRYWDANDKPREESHAEDMELNGDLPDAFRHLRAACESGWDFSSRWLADFANLKTIRTMDVLPVDLNALILFLEKTIHRAYELKGYADAAKYYEQLVEKRKTAIQTIFYNQEVGAFVDYFWKENKPSEQLTLAMVFPLFFGIVTEAQAASVAKLIEEKFLHDGGLPTTLLQTKEQWDFPNGWPPLQWMAVAGLARYGYSDLSKTIAERWCQLIEKVFKKTGKMMEKYNVVDLELDAGGGEYPVQDGFGWTNGVYLAMQGFLKK